MTAAPLAPAADPRYGKKLAIIVPYRNRAEHLARFVPHMLAYFSRDKLDKQIDVTINIIEQTGDAPFQRGRLGNAGFLLTRDTCDYVCVHDVDYLPMWADYSWTPGAARLIWYGLTLREDHDKFFGAVELIDKAAFEKANGFPNCYWGWGPEDLEFGLRLRLQGIPIEKRDGTYIPLPHKHAGFAAPHVWSEEGRRTNMLFKQREPRLAELMPLDGVNSLSFDLVAKKPLELQPGKPLDKVWHYMVDLGAPGER